MSADPIFVKMTAQEYLAWEEEQPLRYEYLYGEVLAMTGGTIPHNQVAVNLATLLKNHLRQKGCKVLTSDAKIAVTEQGSFHYADVAVTCNLGDAPRGRAQPSLCSKIYSLSLLNCGSIIT
jgi:Uma2 family endonuclease